jgi:hypothetical protein
MVRIQDLICKMPGPMLDAFPHPIFLVDEDVRIISVNKASLELIGKEPKSIIRRRAGEILHCIHSKETQEGCGRSFFCSDCIIRNSVVKVFKEKNTVKEKAKLEIVTDSGIEKVYLSIIVSPFEYEQKQYALMQFENITELMQLRKIIPICSGCKKIRNDTEYWQNIEYYFHKYLDLDFSHSLCPDCADKIYSEIDIYDG